MAGSFSSSSSGLAHLLESTRLWQMVPNARSILGTLWHTGASPKAGTPWGRAERAAWASLGKDLLGLTGLAWHLTQAGGPLVLAVMAVCQ